MVVADITGFYDCLQCSEENIIGVFIVDLLNVPL